MSGPAPDGGPGADLLAVEGLVRHFPARGGRGAGVRAVDGVSFRIAVGETLALVGGSGAGKSTVARLVLRLDRPTAGTVTFAGTDVTRARGRALAPLRRRVQVVFQDPASSFDPRRRVGTSVAEPLVAQGRGAEAAARVPELLALVGLDPDMADRHPHQFSGGQLQRLAIARALAVRPDLVVLDEPVSALDVSIQAQILNLLRDLQEELDLTYLFVAHDLAVVRHVSTDVAVMYLGRLVERAPAEALFAEPRHPYTQALLSAIPLPDPVKERKRRRLVLQGEVPSPLDPPSGCTFHPRCPLAEARCRSEVPKLVERDGHAAACHAVEEGANVRAGSALARRP